MLILLPPSEGKTAPRRGKPLDLATLTAPSLTPAREAVIEALTDLCSGDVARAAEVLEVGATQHDLVALDAALRTAPTARADAVYSGVVYDALDAATLSPAARRRAATRLAVTSSVFGVVRPADRIPAYRLSGGTSLPGLGSLAATWRPLLEPEIGAHRGLVVDLRSGPYAALARVPTAVQVRVLRETDGARAVVSHDNKYTKGLLARELCERGARSVADVAAAGAAVADVVEVDGLRVDLVLHGLATARGR